MRPTLFLAVFLISLTTISSSSTTIIYLPHEDSQFFQIFERNLINITQNIATTTTTKTIAESLEICADKKAPFLFMVNTTVIGCGLLRQNQTNISSASSTNCTNGTCPTNSSFVRAYKTQLYSVVSLPVFFQANFTTQLPNNSKVMGNCSFNAGDQSNVQKLNVPFFEHYYLSRGMFRASLHCLGNFSTLNVSRRISVDVSSTVQKIVCPTYFSTNKTSSCTLGTLQTDGLDVKVNIDEDLEVHYNISETMVKIIEANNETVQEMNCHLTENDKKVFIFPSLFFTTRFYLRAIEVVSPISGPVELHVFRINFELKNIKTNFDEEFCPVNDIQHSNSTANVCFRTSTKNYNSPSPITSSTVLTAVHSISFLVDSGYNYIILDDQDVFAVNVGDVIGLRVDQSRESISTSSQSTLTSLPENSSTLKPFTTAMTTSSNGKSSEREDKRSDVAKSKSNNEKNVPPSSSNENPFSSIWNELTSVNSTENPPPATLSGGFSQPSSTVIPMSTNTTTLLPECSGTPFVAFQQFTIYGFLPYQLHISLGLRHPGHVFLNIDVTEKMRHISSFNQTVIVQEPVNGIHFPFNAVSHVNTTQIIRFWLERGTNASCEWSFAEFRGEDVDVIVIHEGLVSSQKEGERLGTSLNFTHHAHGTYTLDVTCYNKVSSMSEMRWVSARRNISAFNASLCTGSFTYEFTRTCWIAKAFGDSVQFMWNINGSIFKWRAWNSLDIEFTQHTPPGEKAFANVSARNFVSYENLMVWFKILENPIRIDLNSSSVFPSSAALFFSPKLSWKGYANGTEFYQSYNVQISEALRQFIEAPKFRFLIDNWEVATNVSNASMIQYQFPKAGEKANNHSLFVEGVGHKIMNRKTYILILDTIEELKITSSCSSNVLINKTCKFNASYTQGSDVIYHWKIGSSLVSENVQYVYYTFRELGNMTVYLNVTNAVSESQAIFNVDVKSQGSHLLTTPILHGSPVSLMSSTVSQTGHLSTLTVSRTTNSPAFQSSTVLPSGQITFTGPSLVEVGQNTTFAVSVVSANVIYNWFIDGISRQHSNTSSLSIMFNRPGIFLVKVQILNHMFQRSYSLLVTVQFPISDLQLNLVSDQFNKTVVVLVSIGLGTNVSFSADFGDNSSLYFGIVPELKNISVSHYYQKPGKYQVTFTVFNLVEPTLTKCIIVFVKKSCVVESMTLRGASPSLSLSQSFGETEIIYFSVSYPTNCSRPIHLKIHWEIVGIGSNSSENIHWLKKTTQNSQVASFKPKDIAVGKYKVIVTMVAPNGTTIKRVGFFGRVSENLVVTCSCGNARTVSVNNAFTLNATVSGRTISPGNLSFEWFCDENRDVTCFGDVIERNSSFVEFPGNFFTSAKTYDFVVLVTDDNNIGRCSQQIILQDNDSSLEICVSCSKNSMKPTHHLETEFIATCLNCDVTSTLTWSWNLIELTVGNLQPATSFNHLVLNESKLVIPANTLQPDTLYKITVLTSSLSKNGFAVYTFVTKHSIFGGECYVTPSQATVLKTGIVCTCQAWRDDYHPLFYEFLYSLDGENYNLFYYGDKSESSLAYVEGGYQQRNYSVDIKIIIKDNIGNSVVKILTVKNHPIDDEDFNAMFNSSHDMAEQVDNLLNGTDSQTAIQLVKTVSGVLNERSSNHPEGTEKSKKIREALLGHVAKLCCQDSYSTEQTLQTLLTVSHLPKELTLQAQIFTSEIYLQICENLNGTVATSTVNNLVEGIASVMAASSLPSNYIDLNSIRIINEANLAAIERLTNFLLSGMKPGEPAMMLYTPLLNIALQKHLTSKVQGERLTVSTHLNEFIVPENIGNITGGFVGTKLISIQNNPYIWTPNYTLSPTTTVASLVLQDPDGQEMAMRNLLQPFSMFLYTPDASQSVVKNASGKINEHASDKFYEIFVARNNSALLVTLHKVVADAKGKLRLRLRNFNRSVIFGNDAIISTETSFPVSVSWNKLTKQETYYLDIKYESFAIGYQEEPRVMKYTMSFQEIGCYYWSDVIEQWVSDGCQVGSLSSHIRTHCLCDHLTWFGGSLIVPPNPIVLSTIADRILDPSSYVTVVTVMCFIFFVYILAIIWAWKKDKVDNKKRRVTWSPGNLATDTYHYQVIVYTGIRRSAGTTANVGFMISGESGKSRKYLLKDCKKDVLKRGSIDHFVITTEKNLGSLDYIHIWHDNTGSDPAWFVNQVVVMDTQTDQACTFLCYRWLAVDEGDGHIQRLVPVADADELVRFRHLFVSRATIELTDAHLWFSVAFRPVLSPFTRVQRVSCCLSLLFTSMMTNAMWYQAGGSGNDLVDLGLFTFSWEEVFIGICSSIIVLPVNVFLVQIFRHCRKKHSKSNSIHKAASDVTSSVKTLSTMTSSANKMPKTASTDVSLSTMTSSVVASSNMSPDLSLFQGKTKKKRLTFKHNVPTEKVSLLPPSTTTTTSQAITSQAITSPVANLQNDGNTSLPYWYVYIGWLCVLVVCVTSATVTYLYGVQFGETKTRKWLLSLSISIVNDIFVAQPLKVLIAAILLAYLIRKPPKACPYTSPEEEEEELKPSVNVDDVELQVPDPTLCNAEQFLERAREKREKDKFMHSLLKSLSLYFLFVVLVLIIAYGQRDTLAYYLTEVQENTFTRPSFVEKLDKKTARGFYKISNVHDFWLWNEAVFIPGLSNHQWYNYSGKWSPFTQNFGGYVFGAARWRQKRLKDGVCEVLPVFKHIISHCTGNFRWSNEDSSNHRTSWNTSSNNSSTCTPPDLWCYQSSETLKTFTYAGELETYSGGGYTVDILPNYEVGLNLTADVGVQGWIDKFTRAVFVEFTLYNPNVNLFSVITLLFEVSSLGNVFPKAEFLSIRLFNYVGNFQIFVLVCHGVFLVCVCYFTYNTGKLLVQKKWAFFRKTWDVYELIVVLLSWLLVAFFAISTIIREWTLNEFRENPTKFTSFWYSSSWNMSMEYVIAWLTFLISLKLLHLFQFNRRMYFLPLTLSNTVWDLLNYSLVFGIVMFAYTFQYYLVLHSYDVNFADIIVTIETLLRVLLGKSNVVVQHHQFPVLERIMLFSYICLMKFILLNIFVIILNDGFFRAREAVNLQRNDFEFIDFVRDMVYDNLGIRRLEVRLNGSAKSNRLFFEDENNIEYQLEKMEKKIERICEIVDFISSEDELFGEI